MSFFGARERIDFNQRAEGIWGEFATPAGKVGFLMTKARLASNTPDLESRLTGLLCPVREVLNISRMDFNQLLQRDLDDHRVATKLLPYIIQPAMTGPAFFPPILAALLPFSGSQSEDAFPPQQYYANQQVPEFGDQLFEEWRYGRAYRFQRMAGANNEPHPVKFGRLGWNQEAAKLVVLDGQHRAMALLAIQRTLSGTWEHSTGSKYRHFYEHRVQALLEEAKAAVGSSELDLSQVEYPVTICWFPDYYGASLNPHVAARKLFVDVNKNARKPSESRLVLLSDTELINIFTRALLNRLRQEKSPFPLHTIEYDNPDKESSRPVRWSVFTNITMLREMVEKAVFGPPKYIHDLSLTFRGRVSTTEMDRHMRKQLKLKDLFPSQIEEDEEYVLKRDELGNENFPQYNKDARERLVQRFMDIWGEPILHILGELLFYKKHVEAIDSLKNNWITDDSVGSLAYDAMFEGVGMYWTLRDSDRHWRDRVNQELADPNDKPEIVKAWEIIEFKGKDFATSRANKYLDSTHADKVKECESFYNTVNTYACQLGAVMTLATLAHYHGDREPTDLAKVLVKAWNATLLTSPFKTKDRRLLLGKNEKYSLNMIPKMDSPHAIYFRYFFLQFLMTEEAREHWKGVLKEEVLNNLVSEARQVYFQFLVKEKAKGYRQTEPTWSRDKRLTEAEKGVTKELWTALSKWFNVEKDDFERWLMSESEEQQQEEDESNGEEAGEFESAEDSAEDLMEDDLSSVLDELLGK